LPEFGGVRYEPIAHGLVLDTHLTKIDAETCNETLASMTENVMH